MALARTMPSVKNRGHDDVAHIEFKTIPQAIRDLNLWEQPCFWIYQAPFHRCARCNYRQHIIPPFKRKDVSYTYRFEQFVLRSLIGSTAEEVARRLGISAETVDRIVENQLTEDRQIDPQRVITDIGLDELSLKKRHRLYVTLMTDLSDPTRPQILAVERGRDTTATLKCLDRLTQEQRQQVRTHRVDMGPAYPAACALRLPHSRAVTDRSRGWRAESWRGIGDRRGLVSEASAAFLSVSFSRANSIMPVGCPLAPRPCSGVLLLAFPLVLVS